MGIGLQKCRDDILLLLRVGVPYLRTADPEADDKRTGLDRLLECAERIRVPCYVLLIPMYSGSPFVQQRST